MPLDAKKRYTLSIGHVVFRRNGFRALRRLDRLLGNDYLPCRDHRPWQPSLKCSIGSAPVADAHTAVRKQPKYVSRLFFYTN